MEGSHQQKEGEFDWILDWRELQSYLAEWRRCVEGGDDGRGSLVRSLRALVIGCGTSPLSARLLESGSFKAVVSVDNDAECIAHMRRQHAGNAALQWHVYDLVERTGSAEFLEQAERGGGFDLIVDKGTFDAILVEGVCYPMLSEVHRLLAADGHYLLCSIHAKELLCPLLATPVLDLQLVRVDDIELKDLSAFGLDSGSSSGGGGAMVLARKGGSVGRVDEQALAAHEKEVMDFYYQEERPLLTPEYELQVQAAVGAALGGATGGALPLDVMHAALFPQQQQQQDPQDESQGLGYTLQLFLEDCAAWGQLQTPGRMTLAEALAFLRQMQ